MSTKLRSRLGNNWRSVECDGKHVGGASENFFDSPRGGGLRWMSMKRSMSMKLLIYIEMSLIDETVSIYHVCMIWKLLESFVVG